MVSLIELIKQELPPGLAISLSGLDAELLALASYAKDSSYGSVARWLPIGNQLDRICYEWGRTDD